MPPAYTPAVARTQLKRHEISPRVVAVEARRDILLSRLSALAERMEVLYSKGEGNSLLTPLDMWRTLFTLLPLVTRAMPSSPHFPW